MVEQDTPGARTWAIKNIPEPVRVQAVEAAARAGETQGEFVTRALIALIKEDRARSRAVVPVPTPETQRPAGFDLDQMRALASFAAEVNGGKPPRSITRQINTALRAKLTAMLA